MTSGGEVIAVHTADEWKQLFQQGVDSKKLVVVDFTASWCPPCRFIAPIFAEIAKKMPHVIFVKVDVDELQAVAQEYQVQAMPTFLFIKEGKVVDTVVGADKAALETRVTTHGALAA